MKNKKNCIDLSDLDSNQTKRINEIMAKKRYEYADFVDNFCRENKNEKLLWSLPFVTRNVFSDDSFEKICRVIFIKSELSKNHAGCVSGLCESEMRCISDNKILFPKDCFYTNIIEAPSTRKVKDLIIDYKWIRQFLRIRRRTRCSSKISPYIIITPLLSSCVKNDGYKDRYFTNICQYLDNAVHFCPMIVFDDKKSCTDVINRLCEDTNYSFLFYEAYCKIWDLFQICRYHSLCKRLLNSKDKYVFDNIDVTHIIMDSIRQSMHRADVYYGLLFDRFLYRLSETSSFAPSFLVWYEGRPADLQVISSVRTYFPKSKCIAYELFPYSSEWCALFFSRYEWESKHAPTKVVVPGGYDKEHYRYYENAIIQQAPMLRAEYNLRKRSIYEGRCRIILLMSYFTSVCSMMLEMLDEYLKESNAKIQREIFVKNHPTKAKYKLEDYIDREMCFSVKYVEGDLQDCLDDIDIAITSSSTSSLEVLFSNVNLVLLCGNGKLLFSGLSDCISKDMYSVCYGQSEFNGTMRRLEAGYQYDNSTLKDLLVPLNRDTAQTIFE